MARRKLWDRIAAHDLLPDWLTEDDLGFYVNDPSGAHAVRADILQRSRGARRHFENRRNGAIRQP